VFYAQVNDELALPVLRRAAIRNTRTLSSPDRPSVHKLDIPRFLDSCHSRDRKQNPVARESRNGRIAARWRQTYHWLLVQIGRQAGAPGGSSSYASTYNRTCYPPLEIHPGSSFVFSHFDVKNP
jgi:hypothetical protein